DQWWLCAEDAGPGSALEGHAGGHGAQKLVAGGSQSGLRVGDRGAANLGVWRGDSVGAGGSGVERATTHLAFTGGGYRSDHTHRVGVDVVQRATLRQSV